MPINDKKIVQSYNRFTNPINKSIQNYLANCRIPMFTTLRKVTIDVYCYNYKTFEKVFGKNMVLLNNLVYDCLVDAIVASLYKSLCEAKHQVGWWTKATLTDMVRRTSAFCPAGDTEDLYYVSYGFGAIDQNTLQTLLKDEVENPNCTIRLMKFEDFSYGKFNAVTMQIINNVVTTLNEMVPSVWPTIYLTSETETVEDRLLKLLDDSVASALESKEIMEDKEAEVMTNFTSAILLFVSSAIVDGGVCLEAAQHTLEQTSYKFWKENKAKKKSTELNYGILFTNVNAENVEEKTKENEASVTVEFTDKQIAAIMNREVKDLSATNRKDIARKLKRLVTDFCGYVIALI